MLLYLAPSCETGETLIGGQYCVIIFTGQKVGEMKNWCDSYGDKDLLISDSDSTTTDMRNYLLNTGKNIALHF